MLRHPVIELIRGIVLILLINFAVTIAGIFLADVLPVWPLMAISAIGLLQLLYVIPWARKLHRAERFERMKGVIIGAVITALLNGGCWLMIYLALNT